MKSANVTFQFLVTVEVGRYDAQPMQEFLKEDLPAMKPYLAEKLEASMKESWQYNAVVTKVKVSAK